MGFLEKKKKMVGTSNPPIIQYLSCILKLDSVLRLSAKDPGSNPCAWWDQFFTFHHNMLAAHTHCHYYEKKNTAKNRPIYKPIIFTAVLLKQMILETKTK